MADLWCGMLASARRGVNEPLIFAVKCPRCASKAEGITKPSGTKGTYREVYVDFRIDRILCAHCGLAKSASTSPLPYELWYRSNFRGHTLWARNEDHVDSLIEHLTHGRSLTGTSYEALRRWMVTNRSKVVEALRKLRERT